MPTWPAAPICSRRPNPLIRTALPGWDNDARRQGAGMVLHGSTPALYQAWLGRLVQAAAQQTVGGEALVCVNAWNEWAEGAYLEPDVHFGAAYLNATGRAVAGTAERRTRLLLVGHDAFPAGSQLLLLLHLGRHLRRVRGMEVAFLLLGGGALADEYRAAAPTAVLSGPEELDRHVQAALAQGFRAALVNTSAAGLACARLTEAGLRCTLLVHELPRLLRDRGLVEAARAGAAAAAHVVFAASTVQDRFHELVAVPPGRGAVLPQGVYQSVRGDRAALRAALRLPPGAVLAMGLGYADLRKGFDLFLQCWRMAQAGGPATHFLWVGDIDPGMHAYLGAEMAAAAAAGTFHHRPWQADGAGWLAAADVHLLTSREDPFPSVVLEAMQAGVPTVAFEEGGGAPDVLQDHGAGAAVPLGDVSAMVRQLHAQVRLAGPEHRARLEQAARLHFGFEGYVDRLLALVQPGVPLVSAAVPSFNYARYLPGRLSSLFAQTCPVAEVLVLDDASTDGSEAAVRAAAAAAGRVVRWLPAERNGGSVVRQWRRAAEQARGEWLWIAEADDLAEPGLLQALVDALRGAPDAVLAFCDSRAVDAAGAALWPDHKAHYREAGAACLLHSGTIPAGRFLRECLAERNLVLNASAVLWRRSALLAALDRCGPALKGFRAAADWRLYAEALSAGGSVAYVAQPLNIHRRHGGSATGTMPPEAHLAEIRRMQRHMHALLGDAPGLLRGQRRAAAAARRALRPAGP